MIEICKEKQIKNS